MSSPFLAALARAPSMGFLAKAASAATMATFLGTGVWRAAVSKKPAVNVVFGSVPVGIMTKNRS